MRGIDNLEKIFFIVKYSDIDSRWPLTYLSILYQNKTNNEWKIYTGEDRNLGLGKTGFINYFNLKNLILKGKTTVYIQAEWDPADRWEISLKLA